MPEEVRAICFPRDDPEFLVRVEQLIVASAGDPVQAAMEATLRESYPLAVISPRQRMASTDGQRRWYVYRDGGYTSHEEADAPAGESSP